jgi:hypothetical protein
MIDDFWRALIIPTCQALITGLLVIPLTLLVCAMSQVDLRWGLLSGLVITFVTWLIYRSRWMRIIEGLLFPQSGDDLVVSMPANHQPEPPIRIELLRNNPDGYLEGQYIDLPADRDQLIALASGIEDGLPLTVHAWTGDGAPFSRAEFEQLRAELIRRGLAHWNNPRTPQRGFALTIAGVKVLKRIASVTPPLDDD